MKKNSARFDDYNTYEAKKNPPCPPPLLRLLRRRPFKEKHSGPRFKTSDSLFYKMLFKMSHPRPLCHLFSVFFNQTSIQFLQQINVKKCPSSKQCWDSDSQPSDHESPPITTKPGLTPNLVSKRLWRENTHHRR